MHATRHRNSTDVDDLGRKIEDEFRQARGNEYGSAAIEIGNARTDLALLEGEMKKADASEEVLDLVIDWCQDMLNNIEAADDEAISETMDSAANHIDAAAEHAARLVVSSIVGIIEDAAMDLPFRSMEHEEIIDRIRKHFPNH